MDCCGLSSTGLQNIDANEITSDNTTIFSNLNVSGYTNLNSVITSNRSTFLSSLNVSGFTTLSNNTTLLSSLNISGFTTLSNDANVNASLYISGINVLETLNVYGTGLSTLYNFRSDNPEALITQESTSFSTLIHGVYPGSEIKFDTILSKSNYVTQGGNKCLTKIDGDGKLNVYHKYNEIIPLYAEKYWIVHDELESIFYQAQLNVLKFLAQEVKIDKVGVIASGAAAGVAAIILALGISSIIDGIINNVDVVAMNNNINNNTNNLNSISSVSTLAITNLQNKTDFSKLLIFGTLKLVVILHYQIIQQFYHH